MRSQGFWDTSLHTQSPHQFQVSSRAALRGPCLPAAPAAPMSVAAPTPCSPLRAALASGPWAGAGSMGLCSTQAGPHWVPAPARRRGCSQEAQGLSDGQEPSEGFLQEAPWSLRGGCGAGPTGPVWRRARPPPLPPPRSSTAPAPSCHSPCPTTRSRWGGCGSGSTCRTFVYSLQQFG